MMTAANTPLAIATSAAAATMSEESQVVWAAICSSGAEEFRKASSGRARMTTTVTAA